MTDRYFPSVSLKTTNMKHLFDCVILRLLGVTHKDNARYCRLLPQRKHRQGMFKLFSRITMRDMHLTRSTII